ncbi:DUF2690 domain-containing protein [Streptomyces sp. NPDC015220]|uniref:helix-turn-helix domain-containing protein n=1 Tax=Streptomyces sp. NPDC015220 TaxID=3364947 RepID=UPI0036F8B4D6
MRQPQEAEPSPGSLVAILRELRDRTGLSLAALATRTPYSKSAWHRYLAGATHPPRSAVEALARLAGADPAPALAAWEAGCAVPSVPAPSAPHAPPAFPSSAREGSAPSRTARAAPYGTVRPGPAVPGRGRRWPLLPALTLLIVAAAVAAVLASSSRGGPPGAREAVAAQRCHGRSCQGESPGASACAGDARTESAVSDATYTVRLRYSPSCGAAWSQVKVRSAVTREVSVRTGDDVLSATYSADDPRGDTSPMLAVSSPRGVEACAEVNGEVACTGLDSDTADLV